MGNRKKLSLVLILLVVSFVLFAKSSYSPSIQGYTEGSFTFPTAEYLKVSQGRKLPPMRTSFNLCGDVMAANFKINDFELGAGFSYLYNTRSLIAGVNFLQSYSGLGFCIGALYHFNDFSIGEKFRWLFCSYRPFNNRFDILEFETLPAFRVMDTNNFELSLTTPVTVCFKSDSFTVRTGIGFDFKYNLIFGAKNEKI